MHVSRGPIARWINAAATDESTPPDRPRMTSSPPTWRPDFRDRLVDVARHRPVAGAAAYVAHEPRQDRLALPRVRDLGVELHAVEAPRFVHHRCDRRRFVARHQRKSRRQGDDLVAVAHPHVEKALPVRPGAILDAVEQAPMPARANRGVAEFSDQPVLDNTAQLRRHRLHPVTDAQHRHTGRPHRRRRARRVSGGHAFRASGKDDAGGCELGDERGRHVVGMNLAISVELAHAPRNQLRVLGAEVQDQDFRMHGRGHVAAAMRRAAKCRRAISNATICSAALT